MAISEVFGPFQAAVWEQWASDAQNPMWALLVLDDEGAMVGARVCDRASKLPSAVRPLLKARHSGKRGRPSVLNVATQEMADLLGDVGVPVQVAATPVADEAAEMLKARLRDTPMPRANASGDGDVGGEAPWRYLAHPDMTVDALRMFLTDALALGQSARWRAIKEELLAVGVTVPGLGLQDAALMVARSERGRSTWFLYASVEDFVAATREAPGPTVEHPPVLTLEFLTHREAPDGMLDDARQAGLKRGSPVPLLVAVERGQPAAASPMHFALASALCRGLVQLMDRGASMGNASGKLELDEGFSVGRHTEPVHLTFPHPALNADNDDDEATLETQVKELLLWVAAHRGQQELPPGHLGATVLEMRAEGHPLATVPDTADNLEAFITEFIPAEVVVDPEDHEHTARELMEWLEYQEKVGTLPPREAKKARKAMPGWLETMRARNRDESHFGADKAVLMAMWEQGLDPTDEAEVKAFVAELAELAQDHGITRRNGAEKDPSGTPAHRRGKRRRPSPDDAGAGA